MQSYYKIMNQNFPILPRPLINSQNDIPKIAIVLIYAFFLILLKDLKQEKSINYFKNEKIYFENYEANVFAEIKQKIEENNCSQMSMNEREFLNGIVRKFRPKKILELGVNKGGSSILILNAIKDINNSKLFSIDFISNRKIGECVRNYFPEFSRKWKLFTGHFANIFMEKIGNNIDLAFIDTSHLEPGEILDFLIILPFLKENAIVIFHDIAIQLLSSKERNEWSPYIIFNGIRGKKIFPSGKRLLTHNIGAIILENNQKKYYHDYFRLLGGQWQYFPKEIYIKSLRKYFKKYYDKDCLFMFEETVFFNRKIVKNNPKKNKYKPLILKISD